MDSFYALFPAKIPLSRIEIFSIKVLPVDEGSLPRSLRRSQDHASKPVPV